MTNSAPSGLHPKAAHLRLGEDGERRAAWWYRRRGYRILARNWRCAGGELDLVVTRAGELVFCEVKTRSTPGFGHPAEHVTPAKQRRVRGLAASWMQHTGTRRSRVRFDVAAVSGRRVEVFRAAF